MSEKSAWYSHLDGIVALDAIVSDRIYDSKVPADAARPYVVFYRTGKSNTHHQGGSSQMAESFYQVSCVADDPTTAESIATAIREATDGLRGTMGTGGDALGVFVCRLVNELDSDQTPEFAKDTGAYVVIQDWRVEHLETAPST